CPRHGSASVCCAPRTPSFRLILPTPTQLYALSLHDALPISLRQCSRLVQQVVHGVHAHVRVPLADPLGPVPRPLPDQEAVGVREIGRDTSELQSRENLVCRLLLEKKKNTTNSPPSVTTSTTV